MCFFFLVALYCSCVALGSKWVRFGCTFPRKRELVFEGLQCARSFERAAYLFMEFSI